MRGSQAGWKGHALSAFSSFGCVSGLVPRCRLGHLASSAHRRLLRRGLALAKQGRSVLSRCYLWWRHEAGRHLDLLALLQTLLVLARLVASCHLCTDLGTLRLDILLRDLSQSKECRTVLPGCNAGLSERGNVL